MRVIDSSGLQVVFGAGDSTKSHACAGKHIGITVLLALLIRLVQVGSKAVDGPAFTPSPCCMQLSLPARHRASSALQRHPCRCPSYGTMHVQTSVTCLRISLHAFW